MIPCYYHIIRKVYLGYFNFLIQKTHLILSNIIFLGDFKKLFSGPRGNREKSTCAVLTSPTRPDFRSENRNLSDRRWSD